MNISRTPERVWERVAARAVDKLNFSNSGAYVAWMIAFGKILRTVRSYGFSVQGNLCSSSFVSQYRDTCIVCGHYEMRIGVNVGHAGR
jgi:hypothetical protein